MDISKATALEVIHNTLTPDQVDQSLIYLDKRKRMKGETIKIGQTNTSMPFDGFLIFVDLAPRFNWAHPCLYLLVNEKDVSAQIIEASFPPYSGEFPDTVIIVLRYGKEPHHERYFQPFD